jgi:hypothetical protein
LEWITSHGADIVQLLTGIVTVASIVANWTKTDSDNKAVAYLSSLVHVLALNWTSQTTGTNTPQA